MYVLGINSYLHDSSAALVEDGRVTFAVEEERLSRLKKDASFPVLSIEAALAHAGIRYEDLDGVAFGWNQGGVTPLNTLKATLTGTLPFSGRYVVDSLLSAAREAYNQNGQRQLERRFGKAGPRVVHVDHHESHAWSA